jgi:hypothetical protein
MYSEVGGRFNASMEENDDLPACAHLLCSLFLQPPLGGLVLSHIVSVISHDDVDDPQEFLRYGDERPHPFHARAGQSCCPLLRSLFRW